MRGIAFHHSGLVPFLKEILEILFSKGLVRVLFATETFAVGINMPTKTVLFTGLEKYDDTRGGHRVLRSDEYIQMAGRAGRRGKDDKGIVLYLPQREPIQPWDMKGMMTGGAARVHSRLSFQYEFILKTFQNSNLSWENLLEKSYWFALLEQERAAAARYVAAAEAAVAAVYLTNDEMEACEQWNEIDKRLAVSVNAKKKAAQKDLARWEEDHSEKHWETTLTKWKHRQQKEQELAFERRNAAELGVGGVDSRAGHEILARLRILAECGYVKEDVGDSQQEGTLESSATILKPPPSKGWVLCEKGRLATEVNEGHPLLIPEMFLSGSLEPLPIVEQLSILAIFLGEPRADDDNHIPIEELPLSNKGQEIVRGLQRNASAWMDLEKKEGGCVDYRYWSMSYEWVEPISKWLQGMSLSEICGIHGLFEGNLQRAILKLANLAEEWMALATLTQRVEVLRVWESARTLILRDIVIAESLYLRL
jgi:superfamily II RNA helicase